MTMAASNSWHLRVRDPDYKVEIRLVEWLSDEVDHLIFRCIMCAECFKSIIA
jgi:hypothetical protein